MDSEGSSAVLELKDDDTGTDDGSIDNTASHSHDIDDALPLIMEHGYDIVVKVDAPMKQLSTLETFVTYRVRCVCARWSTPPYVRRRYNHFKALHKRLTSAHPLLPVPPLPPLHSARQQLDRYSPGFVAVRALALDAFLTRVAKHPILTHSQDLRLFFTLSDVELDKSFKSESGVLSLWGLTTAFYNSGEAKSNNGPRVKDLEFSSVAEYLQSLQQKLTTLCSLTTRLYKGSAALGAELMNMERACATWSAGEGRAVCCGAARAGAARHRQRAVTARAVLPFLVAYASTVHNKIKERDAMHAAYVAGNGTGALHNRLEQASEALRSDLADWNTKTKTDIKNFLIELADDQVKIHQQTLMAWENAYKISIETDARDIFKTVSKNAVQNLSPSKCKTDFTPTETDRDLDDFDIENCSESSAHALSQFQNDSCHNDSSSIDKGPSDNPRVSCQNDTSLVGIETEQRTGHSIRMDSQSSEILKEVQNRITDSPEYQVENSVDKYCDTDCRNNSSRVDTSNSGSRVLSDPLSEFAEIDLSKDL